MCGFIGRMSSEYTRVRSVIRGSAMDQREFLRQMEDLAAFGKTREGVLTKEEIADYCSDLGLSEAQLELVYAYLAERQIRIPGYVAASGGKETGETAGGKKEPSGDSRYLRIYRRELKDLPERSTEERQELFRRLRQGEEEVVPLVIEAHLARVVTLAGKYRGRGVSLEDLIQEGNLELITCVRMLLGNTSVADFKKAIDHSVRSRMIELVDEELEVSDQVSTVLAKVNLLLEATRVLAEEYGRVATIEELAEFTHMDPEEIRMYVDLSLNNIELGRGETNDGI